MKFVADMHTHTLASDHAYSTISENAASAAKAGLSYLGMTDHCINMGIRRIYGISAIWALYLISCRECVL